MERIEQSAIKRGLLRNEKGLTLIELLAVIVILAIIAAIAIPSVSGIIGKTKKESHRANAQIIVDAARYKISVEDFTPDAVGGTTQTIKLETLNTEGYLETIPKDPQGTGTYSGADSKVTVTHNASTGKNTFAITLAASATKKYFDGVAEANIKTATIS